MKNIISAITTVLLFTATSFIFNKEVTRKERKDKDYIVLNNGDTLYGTVYTGFKLRDSHGKIFFYNDTIEKRKYTADNIKAYCKSGTDYESGLIFEVGHKIFLHRTISGKIRCFKSTQTYMVPGPSWGGGGSASSSWRSNTTYYLKKGTSDFKEIDRSIFAFDIKLLFSDCPYFNTGTGDRKFKLNGVTYTYDDIEELVMVYNKKRK